MIVKSVTQAALLAMKNPLASHASQLLIFKLTITLDFVNAKEINFGVKVIKNVKIAILIVSNVLIMNQSA